MHINWATKVSFPHYPDSQLTEALQREISNATDDDLLAAYLHRVEGQIALDLVLIAEDLAEGIKTEQDHLDALKTPTNTRYTGDYHRAHATLRRVLNGANHTAADALREARAAYRQLCEQLSGDLATKYSDDTAPALAVMEHVGALQGLTSRAERDVLNALAAHRYEMHSLALLEHSMDQFLASNDSVDLTDIHLMTPAAFEQTVAALAKRDGHQVIRAAGGARDLGADVITVTPEGRRVVFQCKHRQAGLGKVGSPDIQTLNGTARPEHKADIVVAVTNGSFTKPATDFARSHDIHLLSQSGLKRWATWGESLLSVLAPGVETRSSASHP
ncbi:restriction endonuclease [Streptomyces sp. NPDC056601]|uniref:restriction endonuclease n=1 Tax=Streptomyces sp. NPDC056601 TaxID=3345875 RepID=UPI0036C7C6DC